jgi:hypothetical protein
VNLLDTSRNKAPFVGSVPFSNYQPFHFTPSLLR